MSKKSPEYILPFIFIIGTLITGVLAVYSAGIVLADYTSRPSAFSDVGICLIAASIAFVGGLIAYDKLSR